MFRALQISPLDNIATAMCDIPANMPFDVIRTSTSSVFLLPTQRQLKNSNDCLK